MRTAYFYPYRCDEGREENHLNTISSTLKAIKRYVLDHGSSFPIKLHEPCLMAEDRFALESPFDLASAYLREGREAISVGEKNLKNTSNRSPIMANLYNGRQY